MSRTVEVPAYTLEPFVELAVASTAVIVVDMQNDFVTPGGALALDAAERAIPAIKGLLERARAAGVRIFYTRDTHGADDLEFPIWGEHVLEGTWGWQIVDALTPLSGDRVIDKLRYDGFFGTSLDHELRVGGVKTTVVCGTAANVCVLHTAGSAALLGYNIVVPTDGVAALTPFDLEATFRQVHFLYRGALTTSSAIRFVK
jgi:nicotinamidase-related amidase